MVREDNKNVKLEPSESKGENQENREVRTGRTKTVFGTPCLSRAHPHLA